ncbi:MAG: cobyric acid synthase [Mariprofundaceae bacterium]|nr:cobyric acid synthase [Mariprofundaceae bacterium]
MKNNALMIQGTASGVGKSVVVAGLCRLLARNGVKVAPFKPQNMSNNAAVTVDGGEIGRAQALQALACGIEPTVHMNPVLIKPENNQQAQLIVRGKVRGRLDAKRFRQDRLVLLDTVLDSFYHLQQNYDFIMIEGAGCPAEPNLRQGDIANMGFAEAADVPVWLLGDIDCGGVFAALKGCLDIISEQERARIQALMINRFRGNLSLLDEAIVWLEKMSGKPLLGVIPMLDLDLPEEDAPFKHQQDNSAALFRVQVLAYPRMSNHDDIDPLAADANIQVHFVRHVKDWQACDLLILPGSKHVSSDLAWLREQGFLPLLQQHLRYAGQVLGICGGLQMLGQQIDAGQDGEANIEGESCVGLGYLELSTQMQADKTLRRIDQLAHYPITTRVTGYEIHHGESGLDENLFPFAAVSTDHQVWGTYIHGLFEQGEFRQAWLQQLGFKQASAHDQQQRTLDSLDQLADQLEQRIQPQFLQPLLAFATKKVV